MTVPGISLRPVQDSDLPQVFNLDRLSFAPLRSTEDIASAWYEGSLNLPDHAFFLAVEDATNQGIGTYVQINLGIHFEAKILPSMGIGGVAVAPHRRGQQIARLMLHHALEDARSQHIPLTMLYPFQHGFYRKLGWAWVGRSHQYRVSTHHLPLYPERKDIVPYNVEQESAIKALYQTACLRHNGWLKRSDWRWKNHLKPVTGQEIYCYGDRNGLSGYIIFQFVNLDPAQTLLAIVVQEWVALTPAAYRSILGFLASLRDQISTIIWNTDTNDPFPHFLKEQRRDPVLDRTPFEFGLSHRLGEIGAGFMWRLVDLEQAFRLRPIQLVEPFALTFEILDPVFDTSLLSLEFVNGQMHPVAQSASTTIKISIEQLTALFCGMRQASSLQWSGELEIEGDERLLRHLDNAWQATPPFCWDFF